MAASIFDHPVLGHPLALVLLFLGGSFLMLWRLEHLSRSGLEGTVIGTLVMPYCSGIGNLIFVYAAHREGLPGTEVTINCLVNNVTNMTLLIGLPAVLWGTHQSARRAGANRKRREATEQKLNRLSVLLTLLAVVFFTGVAWALGRDGSFTWSDGVVLVALFLFWQCFQVFDVLKTNVRERRTLSWTLFIDGALLLFGAVDVYVGIEGLVTWIASAPRGGFLSADNAGWLSGWLMVLPNAVLALYYGWRGRPEIIYTSQVGDGHICIPLCLGLAAFLTPVSIPGFFNTAVAIILAAVLIHGLAVVAVGRLPRIAGIALVAAYGFFVWRGWLG